MGSLLLNAGLLYGVTNSGGTSATGVIFRIQPDGGGFTKLFEFAAPTLTGANPMAGVVTDGTFLYGTTNTGGLNIGGTIYRILPDGTGFTKIWDFGGSSDGYSPYSELLFDGTFLFGTTSQGGAAGDGNVYRIKTDGTSHQVLHDFLNEENPRGGLVSDGTILYGMTFGGGATAQGTVYQIKKDGTGFLSMLDFDGETHGATPHGTLAIQGTTLYGMTRDGGVNDLGLVFSMKTDGSSFLRLLEFDSNNGRNPWGNVLVDGTYLYGMTTAGGVNDLGSTFKYYIGPPIITSFSPASGPVGTTLTVNGNYFSSAATNNTVYLGGVRANVTAASPSQLTITVPAGAAHDRISVTVNGLTGFSQNPFIVNFGSGQNINASSFAPKVDLATDLEPYAVGQADFDQDGKLDLVSANYSGSTLSVFQNNSSGPGNIAFAAKVDFTVGLGRPYAITTGDFDGDSKHDFAVANEFTNTVAVFRNTSSGPGNISFAPRVDFPTGAFPHGITAADFNNDGKIDLAVTSNNLDVVSVYSNLSSGSGNINFAPRIDFAAGGASQDVTHADLDSDGRPDLIVTNYSAQSISVLRNTSTSGAITFAPKTDLTAGILPNFVAAGDVDGDGKLDLTVANTSSETISVYRNTSTPGTITLDPKVDFPAAGGFAVGLADLNGDGKIDLAVPDFANSVTVIQNTRTGPGTIAFGIQQGFTTASRPQHVVIGDFDGDGKPDMAVANQSGNSVSVLRNAIVTTCIPMTQRNALIALYNATDGANWTDNTGWLTPDESTWYGITVTGCDITGIALDGNNLIGNIPMELQDLTALETLELGVNQLSGGIPPELGNLANLIDLNLAVNQLSGSVPIELSNLSNLQALALSNNNLTGNLPPELQNLSSLQFAFLGFNQFTGDLPAVGLSSPAMSILHAQFNRFTGVPDFTAYSAINNISVVNNRLTFDDLEPYVGVAGLAYSPQAMVPPGGIISFVTGGTLTIPFSTGGTANSYQWLKNNTPIPGATSATLSIPGATAADVGSYDVQITNSIVTLLTLKSLPYTVITDPCPPSTRTAGGLDAGFAPLISAPSFFYGVATQSTGKIITSTSYTIENSIVSSGVMRFNTDGSRDNSFASNPHDGLFLVLPDDRIIATYADGIYTYPIRLDANGNEDAAFNANVSQYYSGNIYALARQPNNKILVGATAFMTPPFVERFNTDGTSDGVLAGAAGLDLYVITVQSDGYILLGGQFPGGITRLDPSGAVDPTFVTTGASDFVTDIAIQTDGKILVAGAFAFFNDFPHYGIVRLNPNGSIDNTFTALGITDLIDLGSYVSKIAIQSDGKILLAGSFLGINGTQRKNLVRLNSDGTVDCAFNPEASADTAIGSLALQTDGKILISGSFSSYEGTQRYGLARVNGGTTNSITITLQPSDAIVCEGATGTFTTAATGTTGITYQWQFSPDGVVPFADIVNGSGYSGVSTSSLAVNTTGGFGAGRYRCRINGDLAPEVFTNHEGLFINPNPAPPGTTGGFACTSGTIVLTASGASAGQYRWYTVASGGTAIAGEVNATYTTPLLTATTTYYVSIHNGTCESTSRTPVTATINVPPSPPTATGALSCAPGPLTLQAFGGLPGEYRWYSSATGGTDIGTGNDTFTTPVLSTTTTYHVAIHNGTCESTRTPVTATIDVVAKPAITTSNCTALGATLSGPAGFAAYTWSTGATTQQISITTGGTYTLVVSSASGCLSPASDAVTFTNAFCNQPPTLQPTPVTATVQGTVTVNVSSIATDLDNNIDLASLQVIVQPVSGATAFINANFELVVDYSGVAFAGTDQLTIELCDVAGACVQEVITIEVAGDITVYNALSPNGDGKNDVLYIQYIDALPETQQNRVTILNRWGNVVFETTNYDNTNNVFRGLSDNGAELPSGTYYYILEFTSGAPKRTGFISLRK